MISSRARLNWVGARELIVRGLMLETSRMAEATSCETSAVILPDSR